MIRCTNQQTVVVIWAEFHDRGMDQDRGIMIQFDVTSYIFDRNLLNSPAYTHIAGVILDVSSKDEAFKLLHEIYLSI